MTRELGKYQAELNSMNGLQVCNTINSETIEEKCSYNSICGDDDRINRRILEQDLSSLCTGTATFEDIPITRVYQHQHKKIIIHICDKKCEEYM